MLIQWISMHNKNYRTNLSEHNRFDIKAVVKQSTSKNNKTTNRNEKLKKIKLAI